MPVAIVEATDAQALEFAIIENVQRADLNPIEEASGYLALMEEFNHSQDDVAQIVGKSRPHVANMLRLLKLSEPVKALVHSGKISAGHARLLGQPNALEIAKDIIAKGWSVRQIELDMKKDGAAPSARRQHEGKGAASGPRMPTPARSSGACRTLWDWMCRSITAASGGTLHIKYKDLDQLDGVLKKLDRKFLATLRWLVSVLERNCRITRLAQQQCRQSCDQREVSMPAKASL